MHAKIHTATSVLCVHFQFSFHLDGEVTHALSARKAVVFLVYFKTSGKKQVFKKTYEKVWRRRKAQNETHTPLFFPRSSNSSNTPAFIYIYIYITHTQVWILQSCFRWQPAPRLFWANSFPRLPRSTSRRNNRNDAIKSTSKSPRCRTFPEIQTWRNFARDICSRKSRGSATRTWRKTRTRRLLV